MFNPDVQSGKCRGEIQGKCANVGLYCRLGDILSSRASARDLIDTGFLPPVEITASFVIPNECD